MNSFLGGFFDGFTGAGMFLGPKPIEAVSMLDEENLVGDERWMETLQELSQAMAGMANDQQRTEVMDEIRKIAARGSLTPQTAVESGSRR